MKLKADGDLVADLFIQKINKDFDKEYEIQKDILRKEISIEEVKKAVKKVPTPLLRLLAKADSLDSELVKLLLSPQKVKSEITPIGAMEEAVLQFCRKHYAENSKFPSHKEISTEIFKEDDSSYVITSLVRLQGLGLVELNAGSWELKSPLKAEIVEKAKVHMGGKLTLDRIRLALIQYHVETKCWPSLAELEQRRPGAQEVILQLSKEGALTVHDDGTVSPTGFMAKEKKMPIVVDVKPSLKKVILPKLVITEADVQTKVAQLAGKPWRDLNQQQRIAYQCAALVVIFKQKPSEAAHLIGVRPPTVNKWAALYAAGATGFKREL